MLSQEDVTGEPDLLNVAKRYIKERYAKPGEVFLGLLHRLDRPVSGVMVFARTSKAASRISEQIRNRSVEKTYLAVVQGTAPRDGVLQDVLGKDARTNRVRVIRAGSNAEDSSEQDGAGKVSKLRFERVSHLNGLSLLRIHLETGRSHQIRVQLSSRGMPISGDRRYGSNGERDHQRDRDPMKGPNHESRTPEKQRRLPHRGHAELALLAQSFRLDHPTLGERLEFTAPLPNKDPWTLFQDPLHREHQ